MGYWNKIRDDFPGQFDRMASESRRLGVRIINAGDKRIFLDELQPGTGNYQSEPEIQCGIFCEMVKRKIGAVNLSWLESVDIQRIEKIPQAWFEPNFVYCQ